MFKIEICVGSSCHLRGAHQVVALFREQLAIWGLEEKTEILLTGSFCQGNCTQGVNVRINGESFSEIAPEKVKDLFEAKVLGGITHVSHCNPQCRL